ncbi:MAG: hypothetical protein HYY31_06595 [Chloroflexi bacterium]|nr:hypothetical protein [Chloroflexota bacterium]
MTSTYSAAGVGMKCRLLEALPWLWRLASEVERRKLLLTMLDAVYLETKEEQRVVAIRPKPAFPPLLETASTRAGSRVGLITERQDGDANQGAILGPLRSPPSHDGAAEAAPLCSWWRRGRVELPVQ